MQYCDDEATIDYSTGASEKEEKKKDTFFEMSLRSSIAFEKNLKSRAQAVFLKILADQIEILKESAKQCPLSKKNIENYKKLINSSTKFWKDAEQAIEIYERAYDRLQSLKKDHKNIIKAKQLVEKTESAWRASSSDLLIGRRLDCCICLANIRIVEMVVLNECGWAVMCLKCWRNYCMSSFLTHHSMKTGCPHCRKSIVLTKATPIRISPPNYLVCRDIGTA